MLLPASDGYREQWAARQVQLEGNGARDLAWYELSAARARVETQTIGQYLPQDLNFDLNETVNFYQGLLHGTGNRCPPSLPRHPQAKTPSRAEQRHGLSR